jgi:hypothetical protein
MASSVEVDMIQRYAQAEKNICDEIGEALAIVIRGAEVQNGVRIGELRVVPRQSGPGERWAQATCTIAG